MTPKSLKKYIERRISPQKVEDEVLAILLTERYFRRQHHRLLEMIYVYIKKAFGESKVNITVGSCQASYWKWELWSDKNNKHLLFSIFNIESNYLLCLDIIDEIKPKNEKDLLFGYNGYPNRYYRQKYREILGKLK